MRGYARSVECRCDHDTTCAYCLRNAPPWHFTPSTVAEQIAREGEQLRKERERRGLST